MENEQNMTAKDLLHKILDYNYLWSSPEVRYNQPATTRLTQIKVLSEAFGLKNLQYVLSGEFLSDREEGADKELLETIRLKIAELCPGATNSPNSKNRTLFIRWLFSDLLKFRQDIHNISSSKRGLSEGFSSELSFGFYLQKQLKEVIKANLSEIDETLWEILDPLKRTVSKEEINYPDADLDKIDLEWRVENY